VTTADCMVLYWPSDNLQRRYCGRYR